MVLAPCIASILKHVAFTVVGGKVDKRVMLGFAQNALLLGP